MGAPRYTFDTDKFKVIDTEEKAYWLGFIAADGYVRYNEKKYLYVVGIHLGRTEASHLKKFKKFMNYTGQVKFDKCKNRDGEEKINCRVRLFAKSLAKDLIDLGIVPRKTEHGTNPPKIDPMLYRHYIRGYIDGDGCWYTNKKRKSEHHSLKVIGCRELLDWMRQTIYYNKESLGVGSCCEYSDGKWYVMEFSGSRQVREIAEWLYEDANIYMDRKYKKNKKNKILS